MLNKVILKLSQSEKRAFLYLVAVYPALVTRQKLGLVAMDTDISVRSFDEANRGGVVMASIRKKLKGHYLINTIRGCGYLYGGRLQ